MTAWTFINLVWTAVLVVSSSGLYFVARGIEAQQRQHRKFHQWQENQQRKLRQL